MVDTNNRNIDERKKVLETTIGHIERQYGKGSIMWLGKKTALVDVEVISTGSIGLDYAVGVGGIPRGRVTEIFGPESSGKTTLGLHIIAEAQKQNGICAFVDAEHALPAEYAKNLGVDLDNLLISQPDTGEQALEISDYLIRSGGVDAIVIDSVAALVPRSELEGDMGNSHMGLQARLMSQAMRKLTSAISRSKTSVIFINQLREKIGVMFTSPETTPGGRALKFYASLRLDIRRISSIKEKEAIIGNRTKVRVVKNKVAPPFREAEFDIIYNKGISKEGELLDLGSQIGLIEKSGTWLSYGDVRLGQGRENARLFLETNKEMAEEIENKIREILNLTPQTISKIGSEKVSTKIETAEE